LLAGLAAVTSSASAGPDEAAQCASRLGAGSGAFHFQRSSPAFRRVTACSSGPGLGVAHRPARTAPGRFGAWVASAPAGTHFIRGRLIARGRRDGAYAPRLLLGASGQGGRQPIGSPRSRFKTFDWRAHARADRLLAELRCTKGSRRCGKTPLPEIFVKAVRFHLFDTSPPALTGLGGELLAAPVQRGTQGLTMKARDRGAGIRRVSVGANRRRFDSVEPSCKATAQLALALSPCPNVVRRAIRVDTRLPGFHEGENTIAVCAEDYADASPNQRCARRRVRVDNDCPISDPAPKLNARLSFAGGEVAKRVRFGRRPLVIGRLVHPSGAPGRGALVCISARTALHNSIERLVVSPRRADALGTVSARLPSGPSRIVYLTYWRGAERVVTRAIHLGVKPRVGLRVRPRGRLRNGQAMTLRARLAGSFHARRAVKFLAKPPGGRWVPFSTDFVKRTDGAGLARVSHTFRRVSGTQRFRFKVRVPRQRGYPYLAGDSHVVSKTVSGDG
jgi:hypothetical protein